MASISTNGSGRYYLFDSNGSSVTPIPSPQIFQPELRQEKAQNTLRRLPSESIDCIVTDPPYGIEFDQNRYHAAELGTVANDDTLEWIDDVVAEFKRVLKPTGHLYMFTRWDAYCDMSLPLEQEFGELSSVIIWDKDDGGHGMGDLTNWAPRHEFIMYCRGDEAELNSRAPNVIRQQDVRFTDEFKAHPTQKPRALIERLLEVSTEPGDVVLDTFGGTYPVPRAAQRMFRRCVACELDPETHRAGEGLVEKEFRNDPEYGVDWREVTGLEVKQTDITASRQVSADD